MDDQIPLSLEPVPPALPKPALPGHIVVKPSADEVFDSAGIELLMQAKNCVRTFGDFHMAVCATPGVEPFLARLMYDPLLRELPWGRTHLWLVDELALPIDHPLARADRVRGFLVEPSGMPSEQFHPVPAGLMDSHEDYQRVLRETLGWRERGHDRLDYVLFAADSDSPLHRPISSGEGEAIVVPSGAPDAPGASMSLRLINAARLVAIVTAGAAHKGGVASLSDAWRRIPPAQRPQPPVSAPLGLRIRPLAGELRWYLDAEACA